MNIKKILAYLLCIQYLFFGCSVYGAGVTTYFHGDHLGSPAYASNDFGDVSWKENYKPFGDRINNGNVSNDIWYTGKPHDQDTGLSYLNARYYDPQIGRFISIDPVDAQPDNPHSFNRYSYANNNPYKYIDPDGEFGIVAILATFGFLGMMGYSDFAQTPTSATDIQVKPVYDPILTVMAVPSIRGMMGFAGTAFNTSFKSVTKYGVDDFAKVGNKISQKQNRHIAGRKEYRGGGYLDSVEDAQKVLDSFNSGSANIIGKSKQGFPVIKVDGVTGTNVSNVASGSYNQATNIFMIKGTKSPSVVPMNPNWTP